MGQCYIKVDKKMPLKLPPLKEFGFTRGGGIYGLVYNHNKNTLYIGATTKPLRIPIRSHISLLKRGNHPCTKLQEEYNRSKLTGLKALCIHTLPLKVLNYSFLLKTIKDYYTSEFSLADLSNRTIGHPKQEYLQLLQKNLKKVYYTMVAKREDLISYQKGQQVGKLSLVIRKV